MHKKTGKTEKSTATRWPWIVLAAALVFSAYVRIRLLQIPFERDEGEFAYMGQLMLHGIPPYKLAANMKMPGIYAAYAAIMAVFGQSIAGVHLGCLIINLASIVLLFFMTKRLFGPIAGSLASAAFAILSVSSSVDGTSGHATHFVLVFALGGLLLLLKAIESKRAGLYFVSGLLLGTAFLMKQPGAAFGVLALLWASRHEFKNHSNRSDAVTRLGLFVLGGLAPIALTIGLLWHAGVIDSFIFWTVTYCRSYAAQIPLTQVFPMFWSGTVSVMKGVWPIYIVAAVGLVAAIADRRMRIRSGFALWFLLFSFAAVCPGFYFRSHYYVLWLAAVAMFAGAAVAWASEKRGGKALAPIIIFGAALGCSIYMNSEFFFTNTLNKACRMMYGANPFPESIEIAKYIKSHTNKDDTIAVIGSEPQIYFYTGRRAATSYIYMYPMMEKHPYAARMQVEMIKQIEAAKPKYMMFVSVSSSWLKRPYSKETIFHWFDDYVDRHYDQAGLIDMIDENWTSYFWDDEAKENTPTSQFFVAVFERKKS